MPELHDDVREQASSWAAIESRLRDEFGREVEDQRGSVPSYESMLALAKIDALARRQSKAEVLAICGETVGFATLTALLAFWWNEAAAGLQTLLPLTEPSAVWGTSLGLAAAMLALTVMWMKSLSAGRA